MRRRDFVTLVGGLAATGWPVVATAQRGAASPIVGILSSQSRESEAAVLAAWRDALSEAGYVEGRNVTFDYRYADGRNERLPTLANELVQRGIAVLLANTTPPAYAAKAATKTVPIVFVTGVDPVEVGLVSSFNLPGANMTGVTFLSNKLVAKRLELLAALVPGAAPIGMLAREGNPNTETDVRDARAAATALGRTLLVERVASENALDAAIAKLVEQKIVALFIAPQADFRPWRDAILTLAQRHVLATSFSNSDYVAAGGLMSYGPLQTDFYREAGFYSARILKGEKPADLPVLISTKFDFAINLRTARALGLAVPPTILALTTKEID